ncbi:MAG: hypothetical protein JRF63_01840 [Deltaproteobacteria bacterium]|nr:hypothetical protein [Deltaproteobacteria bacterium]
MMKKLTILLATLLLLGCSNGKNPFGPGGGGDDIPAGPLIDDVEITAIDLYQAVKVRLMEDGQELTEHPVPIVSNRDATMRIFVQRDADFSPRNVYARVDFEDTALGPIQEEFSIDGDSTESDLYSTLNLEIPAEHLEGTVAIQVSLRETSGDGGGSDSGAKWPASGFSSLATESNGEALQIVLVPVRYNADGSGRLPDTSDTQLGLYEEMMFTFYPVTGVDMILHEPMDWNSSVSAFGGGWVNLLNAITQLRSTDGAPANHYYYGAFNPADSFGQFCPAGCVLGMSNLAMNPGDSWARASIGLGFPGDYAVSTMVHEVGHAHGREHAPCGLGGQPSDPGYPHAGASIGEWGMDIENNVLKNPDSFTDFMSYCDPAWVSDYTFDGLFDRVAAVNAMADVEPSPAAGRWLSISLDLDGLVELGPELDLLLTPEGEETTVELIDMDGAVAEEVPGVWRPFSDLPGGLVLFPEPDADIVAVRLPGYPSVAL